MHLSLLVMLQHMAVVRCSTPYQAPAASTHDVGIEEDCSIVGTPYQASLGLDA